MALFVRIKSESKISTQFYWRKVLVSLLKPIDFSRFAVLTVKFEMFSRILCLVTCDTPELIKYLPSSNIFKDVVTSSHMIKAKVWFYFVHRVCSCSKSTHQHYHANLLIPYNKGAIFYVYVPVQYCRQVHLYSTVQVCTTYMYYMCMWYRYTFKYTIDIFS